MHWEESDEPRRVESNRQSWLRHTTATPMAVVGVVHTWNRTSVSYVAWYRISSGNNTAAEALAVAAVDEAWRIEADHILGTRRAWRTFDEDLVGEESDTWMAEPSEDTSVLNSTNKQICYIFFTIVYRRLRYSMRHSSWGTIHHGHVLNLLLKNTNKKLSKITTTNL